MLSATILCDILLNVAKLSVTIIEVVMSHVSNVVILSVVMPNAITFSLPWRHFSSLNLR
jgi:hypothetical protein